MILVSSPKSRDIGFDFLGFRAGLGLAWTRDFGIGLRLVIARAMVFCPLPALYIVSEVHTGEKDDILSTTYTKHTGGNRVHEIVKLNLE